MTMDRRQFLSASAVAVVASLSGTACSTGAAYDPRALAEPDLLSVLGPEAVRKIGLRYREMVPAENDAEALHASILRARPWRSRLPWADAPSLAELIESDFAEGRTILVQGWMLSATEARQSALFSLLSP
jgi:hypothetical protein